VTIGRQVFFAEGAHRPRTDAGRRLLAHELAHVTQHDENAAPRARRQGLGGCTDLVGSPGISVLAGSVVHRYIQRDFAARVAGATAIGIPGASAAPIRTDGLCGEPSTVIRPQVSGGGAGMGYPDLARKNPLGLLSVAEIKPAALPCLIDGEVQLAGYIDQGNAQDPPQEAWRRGEGITAVSPMLPSTYAPPQLVVPSPVGTVTIRTAWCTPGLLAYSVSATPLPVRREVPADERARERRRLDEDARRRAVTAAAATVGTAVVVVAGRALWRHFWKAVALRFAARAGLALLLAAADGPLPIGDLVAAGMTVVTVFQLVNDWNDLWREADGIAAREAT
jgi:hypothetical protein